MVCSFCAHEYDEAEAAHACGRCAAFGGCRMTKCPRCGYESPETPKLLEMLKRWGMRHARQRERSGVKR